MKILFLAIKTQRLGQNYPNPFNPKTIINYTVRAHGNVPQQINLSIYNLLGQRITILVDSNQSSGNYKIVFDWKDLTSGIYIYKLQTRDIVQSRKMLLVK